MNEVYHKRTEELNKLHLERHIFAALNSRPISWACDESRLAEGFAKIYLIDGDTAVHAQKLVDKPPITQKQLQDAVDDYIKYYGGTYLKYGCMLVNAFGRPKLYDDEKAEENAKHWN